MEPALIHIVDDDPSIRRALEKLFGSIGLQARSYASIAEFSREGADHHGDSECLVLDVRMPGGCGLDFQEQPAGSERALPVIMMTAFGDIPMSVRAMKAGAIDFLLKPFREQDMIDAVMAALAIDRQRRRAANEDMRVGELYETLSRRERQIMRLVTAGLMNKQIACDLALSMITVKIHRKAAMRKMQARSLADLVRMAAMLRLHEDGATPTLGAAQATAAMLACRLKQTAPYLAWAG